MKTRLDLRSEATSSPSPRLHPEAFRQRNAEGSRDEIPRLANVKIGLARDDRYVYANAAPKDLIEVLIMERNDIIKSIAVGVGLVTFVYVVGESAEGKISEHSHPESHQPIQIPTITFAVTTSTTATVVVTGMRSFDSLV